MTKTIKYAYDTIELALEMASAFEALFTEEGVYVRHEMIPIAHNKTLLIFTIKHTQ